MYEADLILPAADRSGPAAASIPIPGPDIGIEGGWRTGGCPRLLAERGVDFECLVVGHGDRAGVLEAYQGAHRGRGNCGPRPLCRPLDRK